MKRVLLASVLCAPLAVFAAEGPAKDPITHGDPAAGATKAAVCGACHGPNGVSANPEWPKLAGQGSRYLYDQLVAFKKGARANPVMAPQASALSDADMRDLAAHFAAQAPSPGVASKQAVAIAEKIYRGGDAARGVPACGACHGPTGAGNSAAAYPRLSGQHATYAANRLRAYRDLASTTLEPGNLQIMAAVAGKLTDKEIEALASYLSGLQ